MIAEVLELDMKTAIMPGFSELRIIVNPTKEVTREGLLSIIMPWLYAPWPEARERGIVEMELEGETLRALLTKISEQYKQADVDFEPINAGTDDLDFDFDVLVNDKNYVTLPHGLNTELRNGDEVKLKILWRWDG